MRHLRIVSGWSHGGHLEASSWLDRLAWQKLWMVWTWLSAEQLTCQSCQPIRAAELPEGDHHST